jgi:hypothetical protein
MLRVARRRILRLWLSGFIGRCVCVVLLRLAWMTTRHHASAGTFRLFAPWIRSHTYSSSTADSRTSAGQIDQQVTCHGRLVAVRALLFKARSLHRDSAASGHREWKETTMPEKETRRRAAQDLENGRAPSTAAGEFVREEIHHVREGKHGARSPKQAIAIGLSKARRAGVPLGPPKRGSRKMRASAERDAETGQGQRRPRTASRKRKAATTRALKREPRRAASHQALAAHARRAARQRGSKARSAASRRASTTKGPAARRASAKKAAHTRRRRQTA